jgi:hypothetical protein
MDNGRQEEHTAGTSVLLPVRATETVTSALGWLSPLLRHYPFSIIHYSLFIALLWSLRVDAHPLTPIQVEPFFLENNHYQVEATFKIRELFLEDLPISEKAPSLPSGIEPRYLGFVSQYASGSSIWFDENKVPLVISSVEIKDIPDETGLTAPVRVLVIGYTGEYPSGAKSFSWSNEMQLGSYVLLLKRQPKDKPEQEWLEAGQRSKGFLFTEAASRSKAGGSTILYAGLGFLVLIGLGLFAWRQKKSRSKAL